MTSHFLVDFLLVLAQTYEKNKTEPQDFRVFGKGYHILHVGTEPAIMGP